MRVLIHFMPLVFFVPPENIRKPEVFLMFSGASKEISATKWIKKIVLSFRRHLVKFP